MSEKKPSKSKKKPSAAAASSPMDVELLQQIVKLMSANDLNTVDLRDGEKRVVLKRGAAFATAPSVTYATPQFSSPGAPSPSPAPGGSSPAAAPGEDAGLVPIKSPMVGTFYAKANPESKPFVSVGSQVVKDETDVCVIEAMKVFNNIKSEVDGTIAKILVSDGQTVEFGTVLFLVKS